MVKDELFRVEQGPEDVTKNLLRFLLVLKEFPQIRRFFGGGCPAEAAKVKVGDNLVRRLTLFEEFFYQAALLNFTLDRVAIEQMQRLREVRVRLDLAGTDGGARGAAKGGEEISGGVAIGDLDGVRAAGQAREFILGPSDLADAIEQDLSPDTADGSFAEVAFVPGVGLVGTGAKLISARGANIADQLFEIVFVIQQLCGESVQELRV